MWGLGDTLYWVLLLVYVGGLGRHTSLGIDVGLCGASGNTLYWASLGLMWAAFINGFKTIFFQK
jgi:hypothetical protein